MIFTALEGNGCPAARQDHRKTPRKKRGFFMAVPGP
jgi:hypothetical protein